MWRAPRFSALQIQSFGEQAVDCQLTQYWHEVQRSVARALEEMLGFLIIGTATRGIAFGLKMAKSN